MNAKVLIVDDKQMMRDSVGATLQRAGYQVVAAGDGASAIKLLARHQPAAVLTDLKMPEMDGLELLTRLKEADDQLPVVLMTAYGSVNDAVAAMKQGAFDFIQKPFEGEQLVNVMRRAVEHRRLMDQSADIADANGSGPCESKAAGPAMIGESPPMKALAEQLRRIANSHGTVLIAGESGTGKEVVARRLHAMSPRRDRPMLCLNCAALSSSLLESELFGHEKGAFTGADQLRKGRFELADGGTLLLDEISEISPELQAKLLRVLQEGQFERVGSSVSIDVDVRVIATTNRDLTRSVAIGEFRQDLYYRLNVLPVHLPPLRDRLDDVALLTAYFLESSSRREGGPPKRFDDEALEMMRRYDWPGNVRELQNICERAGVLGTGEVIHAALIQPWLRRVAAVGGTATQVAAPGAAPSPVSPIRPLEQVEREQIIQTLGHFDGNRQRTAAALGIGVRTLGLKLKKWKEQQLIAQTT